MVSCPFLWSQLPPMTKPTKIQARRSAEHFVEFEIERFSIIVEDESHLTGDFGIALFKKAVGVVEKFDAVVAFQRIPRF
jgi:hypothetical protein